jgi:short-subunit dehydrogenase
MTRDLHGLRILLTGASRGIGRCLAERLARQGARLLLAARSADQLRELAAQLAAPPADVTALPADVTREEDRQRLIREVRERFGGLDVLINNAGVASWGHFASSSEDILRQVMEVNFFAPAELIRSAIPLLAQGRQPAIVNVASVCGRRGLPGFPEHSASKFALAGLTEALRGEMARFDVDVLLVVPGLVRSDDLARHLLRAAGKAKLDFAGAMPPEVVADHVLRALRKNRAETVVGWKSRWLLRVNRLFPRLVDRLFARHVRKLYAEPAGGGAAPPAPLAPGGGEGEKAVPAR